MKVLIYPEGEKFVAHALELDILGYGKTKAKARENLEALVKALLDFANGAEPTPFSPAPPEFFEQWEAGEERLEFNPAALKQ